MVGGENTSDTEDVVVDDDDVSVSDPHAASVRINDAEQATSATEEDTREKFTVVTLQLRCTAVATGHSAKSGSMPVFFG